MTTKPDDILDPVSARPHGVAALLLRLHFYAGMFVGPFILIAAITGLLYALIPQVDSMVFRHELTVDRSASSGMPLAEQSTPYGSASRRHRREHPPTRGADETTQVTLAVRTCRRTTRAPCSSTRTPGRCEVR